MAQPKAITVVGSTVPALDKAQKALLAEAIRRGEEARGQIEGALVNFGRWMLVNIFADDASAALADRTENPVWLELLSRAGGPTLHLNRKMVYVALRIAAHDKRINDERWRALDAGRKEILLPLGSEKRMRQAAKQVLELKMSQTATRKLVTGMLAEDGIERQTRVTPKRAVARLAKMRGAVKESAFEDGLRRVAKSGTPEMRKAAVREIDQLLDWAKRWRSALGER